MRELPAWTRSMAVLAGVGAVGLAGCGGGSRHDSHEPAGSFGVEVVRASFPSAQRLAGQSQMALTIRNAGPRAIPDLAVTIEGADGAAPAQAFGAASPQGGLADTSRPVWVLDRGPRGGDTAYVNTWALGRVGAGEERTFVWDVTPVTAGTHTVRYRVAAGLDGKARAVLAGGGTPAGTFTVAISAKPAQS